MDLSITGVVAIIYVEINKIRSHLTPCTKINSRLTGPNYRKKTLYNF